MAENETGQANPLAPETDTHSIQHAQAELLKLMEGAEAPQPEAEVDQPTESEESQPLEEEVAEEGEATEEYESESEDEEEYEPQSEREEEGADVEEEDTYTVKVNGEDVEVTYDELISGYSRTSDYTKKTQQLANERKEAEESKARFDAEFEQLTTERQQYQQALGQLGAQMYAGLQKFAGIDWNKLKTDDPMEFSMKREEMREEQERMQQVQHQIQMVQKQMDEDAAKQRNQFIDKTNKILSEKIPEWRDDEKRAGLTKQIRKYAIDNGYQDNEIDNLIDHRSIEVLIKAMRYDAMQNADVKTKKLKNKPKLVKPGAKRAKTDAARRRKAELSQQLKSSGSVKDAALLFEDII